MSVTQEIANPKAKKATKKEAPPAKAVEAKTGEFGEKPDTNKGKLIALLVKGKTVTILEAEKAVYGKAEVSTGAIAGVIKGATMAFEKAGCTLIREGRGSEATLTFSRK